MEGHGICSGKWTYFAGNTTTGKVELGLSNPNLSGLNTSPLVAKFTKITDTIRLPALNYTGVHIR